MAEAFSHMISVKLAPNETSRFRKEWIYETVFWVHDQLDRPKQRLLQTPSAELVNYVIGRFDPDPDAGFWKNQWANHPVFVPSVENPEHLSEILRNIFRLAICDSRDDRGWTALHQACFENHVDSHEETIRILGVLHHLNLYQVDRNGKLAVELLIENRARPHTPSGSNKRETMLIEQRRDNFNEARKVQDNKDGEEIVSERERLLQHASQKAIHMRLEQWKVTREASIHLRTLGGWMEYVDPDTLNRFFYQNELVIK
ncbi:unnamed protein product, partial [Choristocarpus tenellus]